MTEKEHKQHMARLWANLIVAGLPPSNADLDILDAYFSNRVKEAIDKFEYGSVSSSQ